GTPCTTGLALSRKLGIQVSQGACQHLAVVGVLGSFELLHHSGARQAKPLPLALAGKFLRSGGSSGFLSGKGRLRLLLFD
ncbi:MAG: hypothetical protein WAL32_00770, partial [Terriglobales bacterium]